MIVFILILVTVVLIAALIAFVLVSVSIVVLLLGPDNLTSRGINVNFDPGVQEHTVGKHPVLAAKFHISDSGAGMPFERNLLRPSQIDGRLQEWRT